MLRRRDDMAFLRVYTRAARHRALIPGIPISYNTINWRHHTAPGRQFFIDAWVARAGLFQVADAPCPVTVTVLRDTSFTPFNTVARHRTITPQVPAAEFAIDIWLARFVFVAKRRLHFLSLWRLTTLVGHLHDFSGSVRGATVARRGAQRPTTPGTKLPVDAICFMARLGVAGLYFLFAVGVARFPPIPRRKFDVSGTSPHAAVARARATAPFRPSAPDTILPTATRAIARIRPSAPVTFFDLFKLIDAAVTAQTPVVQNCTLSF